MGTSSNAVNIKILGKDYSIGCTEDERKVLLEYAEYLDQKLRETRDSSPIIGQERISVVTALNIAHELVQLQHQTKFSSEDLNRNLVRLQDKIDATLESDSLS